MEIGDVVSAGVECDPRCTGSERREGRVVVRDSFGEDHDGAATMQDAANGAECLLVPLRIDSTARSGGASIAAPHERYNANPMQQYREQRVLEQRCLGRQHDSPRQYPGDE